MIPLHFITIQANKIVPSSKGLSAFLSPKLNFKVQLQETWLLSKIVQWFLSSGSYCCTAEKSLSIFWAPTIEKNTGWEHPAGVQRSPDWAMKAASPLAPPDRVCFVWCELLPLATGSPEWNSMCLAIWGRFLLLRHNGAYPRSLPGLHPAVEEQPYGTGNWEKGRGQGREGEGAAMTSEQNDDLICVHSKLRPAPAPGFLLLQVLLFRQSWPCPQVIGYSANTDNKVNYSKTCQGLKRTTATPDEGQGPNSPPRRTIVLKKEPFVFLVTLSWKEFGGISSETCITNRFHKPSAYSKGTKVSKYTWTV